MSVQVAKSGSGTNPPGRRIQMSLSGSTKSNKADTEKDLNSKETQSNNKTVTKSDNTMTDNKTKSDANKKTTENDANNKKSVNSDNSNAKDKGNNDDKKKGNKSDKNQNGVSEVKNGSTTNGHKVDDSKKTNEEKNEKTEKKATRGESSKQKEVKEKDDKIEKKDSKEQEKIGEKSDKVSDDKKTSKKNEEVKQKPKEDKTKKEEAESKKPVTIDEEIIEIEDDIEETTQNLPETPKKSEKKTKENEITSNEKLTQEAPSTTPSRIGRKSENEDEEEMESLIFEGDNTETHGPLETSTPGKILKLNYSPPLSEQKKLRKETFQAPNEYDQPKYAMTSSSVSSSSEKAPFSTSSYRSISGRRSLRPMKDYSFQSMYRESYRKINTELDYTTSSMNVTVGSEIPSETTFSFFGRGKKRERTPPASYSTVETQQADIDLSPKSPKRPRLDLSGLFGIVSSPITLLRARFTKNKIECSTPNGKLTSKDDNEEVENVSVITSEEVATNEVTNTQDGDDVSIKDIETEEMDEIKEPIDVDLPENENVAVDIKSEEAISSSTQTLNKKRMCSVM